MSAKRANLTHTGDRRCWKSLVTARYSDRKGTVFPRGKSSRRHEKPPALKAAPYVRLAASCWNAAQFSMRHRKLHARELFVSALRRGACGGAQRA